MGLSDIHGGTDMIRCMGDVLSVADVVALVGDITHFGKEAQTREVLTPILGQARKLVAVSGNCDYPEVDACLESHGINLHGKGAVYEGFGFVGLGGSLVTPFHTPNEYTEAKLRQFLDQGRSQVPSGLPLVLVSHQPPINTACDLISSGQHVGSVSVREFIEIHQPRVCLCGHIHESMNVDRINATWIINPGRLGRGHYAFVQISEGKDIFEVREIDS